MKDNIEISPEVKMAVQLALVDERRRIRKRQLKTYAILGLMLPAALFAATIAIPNKFTDGDTLSASKLNENFETLLTKVNEHEAAILASSEYAVLEGIFGSGTQEPVGCTAGTWSTRTLNNVQSSNGTSISLNANQITLAAGTYRIIASAPGRALNSHRVRFRNISDNTDALIGTSEETSNVDTVTTRSSLIGVITVASAKIFELQHRCGTTYGGAWGLASNYGISEVYSTVYIHRIK